MFGGASETGYVSVTFGVRTLRSRHNKQTRWKEFLQASFIEFHPLHILLVRFKSRARSFTNAFQSGIIV